MDIKNSEILQQSMLFKGLSDKDITAADAQYVLQFYVEKMTGNKPTWYGVTGNVNASA